MATRVKALGLCECSAPCQGRSDVRFRLEEHSGPYERWPWRTRLFRNGVLIGRVAGYNLCHAFTLSAGRHLLVADNDCPWESETWAHLVDSSGRMVATKRFGLLGWPPGYFDLARARHVSSDVVDLDFGVQGTWRVTALERRRWPLGSLLRATRTVAGTP